MIDRNKREIIENYYNLSFYIYKLTKKSFEIHFLNN